MKKLCTLVISLSLAATAGAPAPTLQLTCDGGVSSSGCAQPHFSGTNANPGTAYQIDGTSATEVLGWSSGPAAADGTYDLPTGGLIDAGAWHFELHAIGHNGKPHHSILAVLDVTF